MTDPQQTQQRCLAILAALALVSLVALVYILLAPAGVTARGEAGPGFQLPELAQTDTIGVSLAEAEQRPLFNPYRLPDVVQTQDTPPEAAADNRDLVLHGIIRRGGQARAAIAPAGGTSPAWYSAGDSVAGWVVETILDDRVSLRRGDKEQFLLLHPPN